MEKVYGTGENNVKVVYNQNDTYTITIRGKKFTISANGNVVKVEDISISPATLALQIVDAGTDRETKASKDLTAVLSGISGQVSWEITDGSDKVSINPSTGETISVIPKAAGSATIKATCSGKSATCNVTITSVSSVEVTFNLNGGKVNNSENSITNRYLPTETITLLVPTKENYEFNGWDTTQNATTPSIAKTETTIEAPNSNTTYYAQWKEPKLAFRTYGDYENTAGYGPIGTRVFLVSGSTEQKPQTISVGNGTIQDNWEVFYEDSDFVYLIYGDYYPVDVQTNIDCSTITFGGDSTYAVSDGTNQRTYLLKYLRNNKNYTWDMNTMTENHGIGESTYASWNNLRTALNNSTLLSGKTLKIQGSPDIELWDKSWTIKGNSSIFTSDKINIYGYMIYGDVYYKFMNSDFPWSSTANSTARTGYYDTLYFPYRTEQSTAIGYILASPGAHNYDRLCFVSCNSTVGCGATNNSDLRCVRPVIAIAK